LGIRLVQQPWPPDMPWQHPAIKCMEQVQGGLPALGAAYQGDDETVFGPFGVVAEHANRRLGAALDLVKNCAVARRNPMLELLGERRGRCCKRLRRRR
jgi:hypothetical protein